MINKNNIENSDNFLINRDNFYIPLPPLKETKTIIKMKKLLLLAAIATLFACEGNKAEIAKLDTTNDSLKVVVAAKDSIINEAFINIDEIATTLSLIADREKLVTKQASSEINKTTKEQITDNITAISDLLEKNRKTISALWASTQKLKDANVKIDGLQKLVESLQQQIEAKDADIQALAEQVKSLNIEIANLGTTVTNLSQDKKQLEEKVATQTNQMNEVFYIVGSEKSLKERGIVDKKGFIGRTQTLSSSANMTDFTKGDIRKIERISIGRKGVTIVSSHPANSYMMVEGAKKVIEELVITDKDAFWRNSKVLVISYKQ